MKPPIEQQTGPRWLNQTEFADPKHPNKGNCTEACVASLLNIPLSEVSPFFPAAEYHDVDSFTHMFWSNVRNFLRLRGWTLFHQMGNLPRTDTIALVVGKSCRGFNHACLAKGGIIIHDPHPGRSGIEQIDHTYFLLPMDPVQIKSSIDLKKEEWRKHHLEPDKLLLHHDDREHIKFSTEPDSNLSATIWDFYGEDMYYTFQEEEEEILFLFLQDRRIRRKQLKEKTK